MLKRLLARTTKVLRDESHHKLNFPRVYTVVRQSPNAILLNKLISDSVTMSIPLTSITACNTGYMTNHYEH